jgi:hypothetical protein
MRHLTKLAVISFLVATPTVVSAQAAAGGGLPHGVIGGSIGAVLGGALGYLRVELNCEISNCDHMRSALTGAAIGAGVGIVLEYFVRHGQRTTGIAPKQSFLIATREDTVVLQHGSAEASFDVTVVAIDKGPDSIGLSRCRSDAERLVNNTWTVVFRPVCTGPDSLFSLTPADSAVFPMRISGYTDANPPGYPTRFGSLAPGEYRLVFGIGVIRSPVVPGQATGPLPVTSSSFIVRD